MQPDMGGRSRGENRQRDGEVTAVDGDAQRDEQDQHKAQTYPGPVGKRGQDDRRRNDDSRKDVRHRIGGVPRGGRERAKAQCCCNGRPQRELRCYCPSEADKYERDGGSLGDRERQKAIAGPRRT